MINNTPNPKEKTKDNKDFDEQEPKRKAYDDMMKRLGGREYDPKKDEPLIENKSQFKELAGQWYLIKKEFSARNHPYKGVMFQVNHRTCDRDLKKAWCGYSWQTEIKKLLRNKTIEKISEEQLTKINIPYQELVPPKEVPKMTLEQLRAEVITLFQTKKGHDVPHEISLYLEDKNHIHTLRFDKEPPMYIYKSGIYVPEARTFIESQCREILNSAHIQNIAKRVIFMIKADTYVDPTKFYEEEDSRYIPVKNGIYDLTTEQLLEFSPKLKFFNKLPIEYNPEASCEEFKKFIKEILPNKEDRERLQEMFGMCFLRKAFLHKAWGLIGRGRNGKGSLLKILKQLIGTDNFSTQKLVNLDRFNDSYGLSKVHKMLVNICEEENSDRLCDISTFNSVVAGDTVSAREIYQKSFNFDPYCTWIQSSNDLPNPQNASEAFFARWEFLKFTCQFYDTEEIEQKVGEGHDPTLLKVRDPDRVDNILGSPAEIEGIFLWALEGLKRVFINKKYSHSETTKEVKMFYESIASPFKVFCSLRVEQGDEEGRIIKLELKKEFNRWKIRNNVARVISDKQIKAYLESVYEVGSGKRSFDGEPKNCWTGIFLNKSEMVEDKGEANGEDKTKDPITNPPLPPFSKKQLNLEKKKQVVKNPGLPGNPPIPPKSTWEFQKKTMVKRVEKVATVDYPKKSGSNIIPDSGGTGAEVPKTDKSTKNQPEPKSDDQGNTTSKNIIHASIQCFESKPEWDMQALVDQILRLVPAATADLVDQVLEKTRDTGDWFYTRPGMARWIGN